MNKKAEIVKFDVETAVIVALDAKYKDLTITDGKSKDFVMNGLREYRDLRLSVIDGHKEEKGEALAYCNFLDAEKRRILARLEPGETYLKGVRQDWDDKKAAEKAEKEAKDRERVEKIRSRISAIQAMSTNIALMPLKSLRELSNRLDAMEISAVEYMEFKDEAQKVLDDVYDSIQLSIVTATQREKEEAQRKVEAERLEKVHKEQKEAQKKIDEENREIEKKRKELEQKDFERQATIKAEVEAKERVEQKERERLEREEAESRERLRQESLKPDKEKLIKWIENFNETVNPSPQLKSKEAKEILRIALEHIEIILQDAMDKTEKL